MSIDNPDSLILIDSVQSNLISYTDQNPPSGNLIYYLIEARKSTICTATYRNLIGSYSSTISNIKDVNQLTGLNQNSPLSSQIKIFPNPTSGLINIDFGINMVYLKNHTIELIDYLGKTSITYNVENSKTTLYLPDLSPSLYNLLIRDNDKKIVYSEKIIIK